MLDLAINGIDLGRQRGGNESYMQGLLAGLARHPHVGALNVLVGAHFDSVGLPCRPHYVQTGHYRPIPYLLWQQSAALRQVPFDWYLSTFFLPFRAPARSALLIHDLSFLSLPNAFPVSVRLYMRLLVGSAVRRARRIMVLSDFVRSELQRYYPAVPRACVRVVYPGYAPQFTAAPQLDDDSVRRRHALPEAYVLTVSSIHPRKNIISLLRAYEILKAGSIDTLPLVIVGQRYWGSQALAARAQALGVRLLGYIPQADLPAIYRGAHSMVYPSLYEGFGLPPLEAMASGVPVVCGDNTSLPEVVGASAAQSSPAALMVDVRKPEAIAAALARLFAGRDCCESLRAAGLARARAFSWDRTAAGLISALNSA